MTEGQQEPAVRKRNDAVDVLRGVAAVFVVFAHIHLPGTAGTYCWALSKACVPYFLLVTGWFCWHPDKQVRQKRFLHSLKKSVILLLWLIVICLAGKTIANLLSSKPAFSWWSQITSPSFLKQVLIFGRAAEIGSTVWYLNAVVVDLLLLLLINLVHGLHAAYLVMPVLLFFGVRLAEFLYMPWYYTGNWLLEGLPFLLLGLCLHEYEARIPRSRLLWGILSAVGFGLILAERTLVRSDDVQLYIGVIVMVPSLLELAVHDERPLPKALTWFGRKAALPIYMGQIAVRDVLYAAFGQPRTFSGQLLMPFVVILILTLYAALADLLKRRLRKKKTAPAA